MGKYTNEKGLVVVQDNFLTKIKKFFTKAIFNFKSKHNDYDENYDYQLDESENEYDDNKKQEFSQNSSVEKERKLFDFDAEDTGDWPVNEVNCMDQQNENCTENNIECEEKSQQSEGTDIDKKDEDEELDYEKEEYSQAYIEKQEIEQKLINYYNSIKNNVQ